MSWRIGGIPYLNVRPLIWGIEEQVTFCEPAELADRLRRGDFDVGIVPVAEVLTRDQYDIVDDVAVASDGPVRSVFLAHRGSVATLKRVAVTPVSRTSVWLLRVLLKQSHGIEPEFYPKPANALLCDHEAMLLIGDEAVAYAMRKPSQHRVVWDLGIAWKQLTGLPFVYAVWAMQRGIAGKLNGNGRSLPELLRQAKVAGLAHIDDIVQGATIGTPEFRREYYRDCVRYDLGTAEKQGLKRFQQYLVEMGLVQNSHDLRYVT